MSEKNWYRNNKYEDQLAHLCSQISVFVGLRREPTHEVDK